MPLYLWDWLQLAINNFFLKKNLRLFSWVFSFSSKVYKVFLSNKRTNHSPKTHTYSFGTVKVYTISRRSKYRFKKGVYTTPGISNKHIKLPKRAAY